MVGLDTGFFISLMKNSKGVKEAWKGIREQEAFPIVSILTIGEILYLAYRIGEPEQGHKMVKGIGLAASVQAVDQNITEKAAGLKHGRGMPYVDALILATFFEAKCKEIHTTDRVHFRNLGQKGIRFIYW